MTQDARINIHASAYPHAGPCRWERARTRISRAQLCHPNNPFSDSTSGDLAIMRPDWRPVSRLRPQRLSAAAE